MPPEKSGLAGTVLRSICPAGVPELEELPAPVDEPVLLEQAASSTLAPTATATSGRHWLRTSNRSLLWCDVAVRSHPDVLRGEFLAALNAALVADEGSVKSRRTPSSIAAAGGPPLHVD